MSISRPLVGALAAAAVCMPLAAQRPSAPRGTAARPAVDAAADSTRRPSTVLLTPAVDEGRGLDAELRMALFDLASDRPLSALARLEWLRGTSLARAEARASGLRARDDLLFLLAEGYYRLGMSEQFRSAAQELLRRSPSGRYAGVIASQLLIDAYRRGDEARVRELMKGSPDAGDRTLTALVAGLSAYQARDFAAAQALFNSAQAGGGSYAPYARYMGVLAALEGDTTRASAALDALKSLAGGARGAFGDHVRLTAAALAYQSGQYDTAVALAGQVTSGGARAQALLTKAWALYKAGKLDAASAAFASFAKQFPQLPQRDEARLMAGQAMLESGQSDAADSYFQAIADSIGQEVTALQTRANTAIADAAQALVKARAAGVVFVNAARGGQPLALSDAAGADDPVLLSAFAGTPTPASTAEPLVVSPAELQTRVAELGPAMAGELPQRLLYAPADASSEARVAYADKSQALLSADISVELARYRLQEQVDARTTRITSLQNLLRLIAQGNESLAESGRRLAAAQDSLEQMRFAIDRAAAQLRASLERQLHATRRLVDENAASLDSARASLGTHLVSTEADILETDVRTVGVYRQLLDNIERELDAVIARHPVFALRDSIAARLARARVLHDETQAVLAANQQLVEAEIARLQASESERTQSLRAALESAEAQRSAAEGELIKLVDDELQSRAGAMVALLARDREAADYGSASAAFFKAIDEGGRSASSTAGTPGASEGSMVGARGTSSWTAPVTDTTTPPR